MNPFVDKFRQPAQTFAQLRGKRSRQLFRGTNATFVNGGRATGYKNNRVPSVDRLALGSPAQADKVSPFRRRHSCVQTRTLKVTHMTGKRQNAEAATAQVGGKVQLYLMPAEVDHLVRFAKAFHIHNKTWTITQVMAFYTHMAFLAWPAVHRETTKMLRYRDREGFTGHNQIHELTCALLATSAKAPKKRKAV